MRVVAVAAAFVVVMKFPLRIEHLTTRIAIKWNLNIRTHTRLTRKNSAFVRVRASTTINRSHFFQPSLFLNAFGCAASTQTQSCNQMEWFALHSICAFVCSFVRWLVGWLVFPFGALFICWGFHLVQLSVWNASERTNERESINDSNGTNKNKWNRRRKKNNM